jgi:hypothetical protein
MTTLSTSRAGSASTTPLARRAALAAALAAGGNLVLSQLLAAAVDADSDFVGLQASHVIVASVVGVLLGLAAYVVLRRLDQERLFVPLIAVGALLSLGGPLSLLGKTQAEQPGVSDGAALSLIPLHLLVGLAVALVLPRGQR